MALASLGRLAQRGILGQSWILDRLGQCGILSSGWTGMDTHWISMEKGGKGYVGDWYGKGKPVHSQQHGGGSAMWRQNIRLCMRCTTLT